MHPGRLPFVDLHLHQERSARLNQVLAANDLQQQVDWSAWRANLAASVPAGVERLWALWASTPTPYAMDVPAATVARLCHVLGEAAAAGAVLTELRVGNETIIRPDFFDHYGEALSLVQHEHPQFRAGLIATMKLWSDPDELQRTLDASIRSETVSGIDILYQPYEAEADLSAARDLAEQATAAGLGLTAHGGEFSTNNISTLLQLPGLTRIGHATHALDDSRLLDELLNTGVTVECCLSSNLVLGAVPTLASHPIRRMWEHGVPIVLGTDNPLHFGTSIDREYQLAASLGFKRAELLAISRTAIERAFIDLTTRHELLALPALNRGESRTA